MTFIKLPLSEAKIEYTSMMKYLLSKVTKLIKIALLHFPKLTLKEGRRELKLIGEETKSVQIKSFGDTRGSD